MSALNVRGMAMCGLVAAILSVSNGSRVAAQTPAPVAPPVNVAEAQAAAPTLEFAFEEYVTLGKAVVVGETPLGIRQYIPITGGTVSGPKFNGKILPGGWDWQLRLASGCASLAANYMIQANDGTIVNVSNKGMMCGPPGKNSLWTPTLEAPKGAYEWMTGATFVDVLTGAGTPDHPAVRIRFYQIK